MRFRVLKSSDIFCDSKPCEEAKLQGSNYYTIEINTLEELIDFKNKTNCEIIIGKNWNTGHLEEYQVEIYDTYRE